MVHLRSLNPLLICVMVGLTPGSLFAQSSSSRERDMREWDVKLEKMETRLLPALQKNGVDMWIIMSRENNPDPALELFGSYGITGWYGARNAYLLSDRGDGVIETAVIGTHLSGHLGEFYDEVISYHGDGDGLAPRLREYVAARDPAVIAVNRSPTISMADGLSAELEDYLNTALGPELSSRIVSSEPLLIDYVSNRTRAELEIAKDASEITWDILRRAFSSEVITPGETTLMDVHWWIKDQWKALDLEFNFPSSLNLQRQGGEELDDSSDPVIRHGDLLHVDFGVKLMGIVTDQQKMAYVLRPGETAAPPGLREVFAESVRVAEKIAEELRPGVPGFTARDRVLEWAESEGIQASVYSHTQGNWVHGAGAWAIQDWPERYGVHPQEPVRATEFWSVEFSVSGEAAEWGGQSVRMSREEDAWVGEDGVTRFMTGPQGEIWLVGDRPVG